MSRRSTSVFATVALFLLTAHQARAQTTISFSALPSSPAAGQILGAGSYSVGNKGYEISSVTLYAVIASPPGQGGEVTATLNKMAKTFNGLITGLPAADYNVFARITITSFGQPVLYFDTAPTK